MNANATLLRSALVEIAIGTIIDGGYYVGPYAIDDQPYGLIVAPKSLGELAPQIWIPGYKDVPGALSLVDGRANTQAMAAAGSKLAQQALDTEINGFKDWYIGALDENEMLYRALKPTTDQNSRWYRSGINLSAIPPTWPYSADSPAQTSIEAFRAGGSEALEAEGHWTSTQHASDSDGAYYQDFGSGLQGSWYKDDKLRARLVRRLPL